MDIIRQLMLSDKINACRNENKEKKLDELS
jgi:hypothetical protein